MRLCRDVGLCALSLVLLAAPAFAQEADDFNPQVVGAVRAVAIEPRGSIMIGGPFSSVGGVARGNLARVSQSGQVDLAFGASTNGAVSAIAVLPSTGHIVIAGEFTSVTVGGVTTPRARLAKLNVDGTLDPTFDPGANGDVSALAVQAPMPPSTRWLLGRETRFM